MLLVMRVPAFYVAILFTYAVPVPGQTADRSAAPNNPAMAAPPTRSNYSVQNGELVVAPGLRIPNGNVPWALDTVDGKQVLVPIHHAALEGSSSSGGETVGGSAARTALRSATPVFFIHTSDRTENTGDSGRGVPTGWALVSASSQGGDRTVPRASFSQVNSGTVCEAPVLCTTAETLPDGWLRIVPKDPLPPGEYALKPVPRSANSTSAIVYDFSVGQSATPKDAVSPGMNLDVHKGKKK